MMSESVPAWVPFLIGIALATIFWTIVSVNVYPRWEDKTNLIVHWESNLYHLVPAEKVYRWEEKKP